MEVSTHNSPFVVLKLKIEDDPPTGHLEFGISPRVSCIIMRLRFSSAKSKQFWQLDNITPTRLISCWKRKQQLTTGYFLSFLDIEADASLIMIPKWNLDVTKG